MTTDLRPKTVADTLKEISRRLYVAEQQLSRPLGGGSHPNLGSNPSVSTITIGGIVVGAPASPATNLVLTTGAFMNDIWVDADWDAPADGTAAEYDVELAKKTGTTYELIQNFNIGGGTSLRMPGLQPQTTYGVRVTAINRIQARATPVPAAGFMDITTGIDATVPAQTVGVAISTGIKSVTVTWDEVADQDVARGNGTYEVHLDTINTFTAPTIEFTSATIISFTGLVSGTTYYVRVRAVDNSGNAGAWSATVSGTTGQVQSVDLADTSVITSKLADGAVDTAKLGALAVEAANLANGAITNEKVAAAAITTAKLADLAVDNAKLAALAVDAAKLADSAVTATKIANLAVGTAAIANAAVGSAQIADAAIVTAKIGAAQITDAKIADLAVGSAAIKALAVGTGHIADLSVITAKIGDLAVNSAKIAALAVTTAKIADLAVDDAKIASLSATKINAGTISADRIGANTLDVNKLTSSTLTSKTITIGAGGVLKIGNAPTTGVLINDQGIRLYSGGAVKVALDVAGTASFEGNISASTITTSTLTSPTINSATITGSTVRTQSSGQRVAMEAGVADRIKLYSGAASEETPGHLSVGTGPGFIQSAITSPKPSGGHGFSQMALTAYDTSTGDTAIDWRILNGDGTIKAYFQLKNQGSGEPVIISAGGGWLQEFFLDLIRPGTNAQAKIVGSGDYSFIWFHGGGAQATVVVNFGLGAGVSIMDGGVGSFQPIRASAFTVASAAKTKRNIRTEGEALSKIKKLRVVRYQRNYENKMADPPSHMQRFYDQDEVGFLAEEMLEIFPEAVVIGEGNQPNAVNLNMLVALLAKGVQELANQGGA